MRNIRRIIFTKYSVLNKGVQGAKSAPLQPGTECIFYNYLLYLKLI